MNRTGALSAFRYRFALALIGLALALRIAIPAGWMPAQGQGFAVTLCSGTGGNTIWIGKDGKLHEEPPQTAPDHHCAFAGSAAPLLGGVAPLIAPPRLAVHGEMPLPTIRVAIGQGLAAPPPPATGPPILI